MNTEALRKRIAELSMSKLHCSQVMMILSQELRGEEEPAVISAVGGLGGGMYLGLNCGTLTAGACVLSSYCARGSEDEEDTQEYKAMVIQLVDWFKTEFGSVNCMELVSTDRSERQRICPNIMEKTFLKCIEILESKSIDPRA